MAVLTLKNARRERMSKLPIEDDHHPPIAVRSLECYQGWEERMVPYVCTETSELQRISRILERGSIKVIFLYHGTC